MKLTDFNPDRSLFLPKPTLNPKEGKFGAQVWLPLETLISQDGASLHEMIQQHWMNLYRQASYEIATIIAGRDERFYFRFIPLVLDRQYDYRVVLELHYEIFAAPSKQMVFPEFQYRFEDNRAIPVEWRCGYCKTPNAVADRSCTKCGAPRALLIQEMKGG